MEVLQNVTYNDQPLTILGTSDDPWFIANEVGKLLGFKKIHNSLSKLDADEKGSHDLYTLGGAQKMTIISESALYYLVARSNLPAAKAFDKKVRKEILPAIRKQGFYTLNQTIRQKDQYLIAAEANLQAVRIENETLHERLRQSRLVVKAGPTHVKLSDRIAELNILPSEVIQFLNRGIIDANGGKFFPAICNVHKKHLSTVSKKLSTSYNRANGEAPAIAKGYNRSNLYSVEFFERGGDKILRDYYEGQRSFLDEAVEVYELRDPRLGRTAGQTDSDTELMLSEIDSDSESDEPV